MATDEGLGHVTLQLAKIRGLRVFAVASKDDRVALAHRLGADEVAEGHSRSLRRQMHDFATDGFDGALVFTGARGWEAELQLVKRGGVVAHPDGVEPPPKVPRGCKRKTYDGEDSPNAFVRLNELIRQGPFQVEISKIYPLDATAQALRDVQHHHIGKLAIEIMGR